MLNMSIQVSTSLLPLASNLPTVKFRSEFFTLELYPIVCATSNNYIEILSLNLNKYFNLIGFKKYLLSRNELQNTWLDM